MLNGMPTRVATAMVICAQIAAMFLAITIPAPQSLAHEGKVQLVANDIVLERDCVEASLDEPAGDGDGCPDEVAGEESDEAVAVQPSFGSAEPGCYEASNPIQYTEEPADSGVYEADELRTQGVIYDGDFRYTWYSQRVLPGGGLAIDGRHVSGEGYVVDADERIVVASSDLPRGTVLDVPFGSGKAVVLDTGCACGTIDVYTDF